MSSWFTLHESVEWHCSPWTEAGASQVSLDAVGYFQHPVSCMLYAKPSDQVLTLHPMWRPCPYRPERLYRP
eukprot:556920-Rhodomonas_salina.1